jgi:hypothetical protein
MMGAPWLIRHPQSGLVEYLVLEMSFEEEFSNHWSHFKESWESNAAVGDMVNNGDTAIKDSTGITGDLGIQGIPAAKGFVLNQTAGMGFAGGKGIDFDKKGEQVIDGKVTKGKATEAADSSPEEKTPSKKSGGKTPTEKGDDDDDDPKKRIAKLFREASKVKTTFHSASSSFVQMSAAIEADPAWSWAKGGVQHHKLVTAQNSLKAALNDWHREFVCSPDVTGIRKKYSVERCTVELNKFIEAKPLVDKLAAIVTNTNRAHEELQHS